MRHRWRGGTSCNVHWRDSAGMSRASRQRHRQRKRKGANEGPGRWRPEHPVVEVSAVAMERSDFNALALRRQHGETLCPEGHYGMVMEVSPPGLPEEGQYAMAHV